MATRLEDEQLPAGVPPVTYAPREPRLRRPPFIFIAIMIVAMVASWVPLVLFARGRVQRSESPRVHMVQDMGTQPKFREQQTNDLFADGRADRPQVAGTVARGSLQEDDHYFRGYTRTAGADGKAQVKFLEGFPKAGVVVEVNDKLLDRGRDRFNIYCTACHGWDGSGMGPVRVRARELGQEWQVANLTDVAVRGRPEGHIFNTITNGIRSMPSYSSQIVVADRWAIVAYVRALQAAQPATEEPKAGEPAKTAGADGAAPAETAAAGQKQASR